MNWNQPCSPFKWWPKERGKKIVMLDLGKMALEMLVTKCHIFTQILVRSGHSIFSLKVSLSLYPHCPCASELPVSHWGVSVQFEISRAKPSDRVDAFLAFCEQLAFSPMMHSAVVYASNANILKLGFVSFPGSLWACCSVMAYQG